MFISAMLVTATCLLLFTVTAGSDGRQLPTQGTLKVLKKKTKKKNNSFRDKTPAMEKQRTRIKYEVT